ncbi:MAG: hypothetical protein J6A28_01070 [Clostridia bacterium]|nr:hypothetical protein [Clostridia bacterium]
MTYDIKFENEDLASTANFAKRFPLYQQYEQKIKELIEKQADEEELLSARADFIKNFSAISREFSLMDLKLLDSTSVFFELQNKDIVVKDILQRRKDIIALFAKEYKAGKISQQSLENIIDIFGAENKIRESIGINQRAESENKLTTMDMVLIQRKLQQKELLTAIDQTYTNLQDFYYIPWLLSYESDVKHSFNDSDAADYMEKIFSIARSQKEKNNTKTKDAIYNHIPSAKFEAYGEVGLIDLSYTHTYETQIPQSFEEYERDGAQYETVTETEYYQPEEIENLLPANVKLQELGNSYYLEMKGRKTSLQDLQDAENEYSTELNAIENA